ncbi:MAG: prephenate dehydratase [Deltaproteobacteria bacterium]|nr:prephenate dehydratase [Deltaproteobacteria bacterium]
MKKDAIKEFRAKIDGLDDRILDLLNKRSRYVMEVGKTKAMTKRTFYAPERERDIYKRLTAKNKGPFPNHALKNVYREIMSASLSLEKPMKIAFLGPNATFTHQACIQHFGSCAELVPEKDISVVFDDVERGMVDFGVVPIENTTEGVVNHTLDMFVSSELKICAEILLEVSLSLLNKSGSPLDIARICSHPHAIAQCKNWLKENLPNVPHVETASTASAAESASADPSIAAIASEAAALLYDLKVVEKKIEDNINNFTRFLVIGKKESKKSGSDKTSIMFAVKDAPGILYEILKPFAERKINLTKIESRPLKKKAWEYIFFLDLDGHIMDKAVRTAVSELEKNCSFVKFLGSYPKG